MERLINIIENLGVTSLSDAPGDGRANSGLHVVAAAVLPELVDIANGEGAIREKERQTSLALWQCTSRWSTSSARGQKGHSGESLIMWRWRRSFVGRRLR